MRFSEHFQSDRSFTLSHLTPHGDTWILRKQFVWAHSAGERQSWGWGLVSAAQSTCLLTLDHGHFTDEETEAQSKSSRNPGNQRYYRLQDTSTSGWAGKLPTRWVSLHLSPKGRVLTLWWCNQRQDSMSWWYCKVVQVIGWTQRLWLEGKPSL